MSNDPSLRDPGHDYCYEAHRAAVDHLYACQAALDAEEEEGAEAQWPDGAGPFCGCYDCLVREVLTAAWPIAVRSITDALPENVRQELLSFDPPS